MKEQGVAVVIGAGTMGGGIAADLANAGWTVYLLDQSVELAEAGKARVVKASPPLLYLSEFAERIVLGSSEELGVCANADWVIEAIAENLALKQALFTRLESVVGPETLVTSNTSGLSLTAMSKHCGMAFRRRFFGTHFFNPPRYLKLVEVVPTPATNSAVLQEFIAGLEAQTNHRVVIAKDTPGFISTRLWITHLLDTIHTAIEQNIPVEVVDALTGPALGRPRSATFRMADLVGLDIIASIAKNQYEALPHDPLRERLRLPDALKTLLAEGRTGQKSGAGFYKREGKDILALDWATLTYRPRDETITDAGKALIATVLPRFCDYAASIA
ncbi:3-hydroxyacyl-CoA dehydrogenase family protein, partial [Armatimonas sp.]|uniref:3-hydroxyacyl-CoA dehydrogenase family protein n=1 Tax=Armatimonas sp. TaxID=1872638 RepID=UPI00286CD066